MSFLQRFLQQVRQSPDAPAVLQLHLPHTRLACEQPIYSYQALFQRAQSVVRYLLSLPYTDGTIGLVMGNSAEWVAADIALQLGEWIEVPVPLAFSAQQAAWLLQQCPVIIHDHAGKLRLEQWQAEGMTLPGIVIDINEIETVSGGVPEAVYATGAYSDRVIKVIHTSGTTSNPKGVRIRRYGLDALLEALWQRVEERDYQRYLNLVPLSLLIEQVTAIYMPLSSGGAVIFPPQGQPPLGTPGVVASDLLPLICQSQPSALTLTPALVAALAEKARDIPASRRITALFGSARVPMLAAGGAPVALSLLRELEQYGIPVYQGYGLSENGSVACLNCRGANKLGTVGQPLPHVETRILPDGELCLRSTSMFAGYANEDPSSCQLDDEGWLHTGDLATEDSGGFISIVGRKKSLIITANGRNVSPEWLESAYGSLPGVIAVIIYGDQHQFLGGIFIMDDMARVDELRHAIIDYARHHLNEIEYIPEPLILAHTPTIMQQLFTVTGRPRREAVPIFLQQHGGVV